MKKFAMFLCVAVLVFGFVSNAAAYSGTYMFTLDGNDSNYGDALLEQAINQWFSDNNIQHDVVDLDFYSKIDAPATTTTLMDLTYEDDNKSGTWFTDEAVEFYTVKSSTEFAFYWLEGGASSGTWSTEHLLNNGGNIPEISHLSTWSNTMTDPTDPPPPVDPPTDPNMPPVGDPPAGTPEPATMVLLGIGLMGVAVLGKKSKK